MNGVSAEVYVEAFKETKSPAILCDENFEIIDVNEALVEFTGFDRETIMGKYPPFLMANPGRFTEEVAESLANNETWTGSFELKTQSGTFGYGQGSAAPIFIDGDVVAYVGFFSDLTQRVQYENTLKILNRVLRHNLKNDANVIMGYIDAVRSETDNEQHKEFLTKAESRVQALLEQAETARSLESVLSDNDEPLTRVRLETTVNNTIKSVRAKHQQATFKRDLPQEPLYCIADEGLKKALEAVIDNGVVHNDNQNQVVSVTVEKTPDDMIHVIVEDNGSGVDLDDEKHVFGRKERDQIEHGQGLSLFFVDQLMNRYQGSVDLGESESLGGAKFTLELRAASPLDN